MPAVGPATDDGHQRITHIILVDNECRTGEKRSYRTAQQHRTHYSVDDQKHTIGVLTQKIARLRLKFVTDSLQYETEQNNHPKPVGTAETGAIEQWERSEKGTTESNQCSKRKLPLTSRRIDHHFAVFFRLAQTEQQ